ncbi:hypothetical protein E2C01_096631 [Portunus trituberculatus]|uniref:Uncharacterized protein n=1 Tax=Portunus trituberculatus TaxID=210409 RepID=A0A5B7K7C5_PORTR|nr:hypothetical protein [Portunus trituberculatus]
MHVEPKTAAIARAGALERPCCVSEWSCVRVYIQPYVCVVGRVRATVTAPAGLDPRSSAVQMAEPHLVPSILDEDKH